MEAALLNNILTMLDVNANSFWVVLGLWSLLIVGFLAVLTTLLMKLLSNANNLSKILALKKPEIDVDSAIRNAVDVTEALRVLKHDNFADRVSVVQMHNGEHSITGIDFFKISITHQSNSKHTYPTIVEFDKGKPIATLLHVIEAIKIDKKPWLAIPDVETMHDDNHCRSFYLSYITKYGTKSIYFFPVTDVNGYLFGMGMIEYTKEKSDMEEKRLEDCKLRFQQIGAMLSGVERND